MSALAAFQARTAYANHVGDQWISWPSGSIRAVGQLPAINTSSGQHCVIQEHPAPALDTAGRGDEHALAPALSSSSIHLMSASVSGRERAAQGGGDDEAWDVNRMLYRLQVGCSGRAVGWVGEGR